MGQFNCMNYCIAEKYSKFTISKAISAISLEKQWRNLWYVRHIGASEEGILWPVLNLIIGRLSYRRTGQQHLDMGKLKYTLGLPFEHALYRLHVYTDLHISRHFASSTTVDHSAPIVR